MICGDLEELRRILKTVDFIQYDSAAAEILQETFRILHQPADPGQLTVEILNIGQRTAENSLSNTSNAGQPNDCFLTPCEVNTLEPELSVYHMQVSLQIVLPNARDKSFEQKPIL
jgi:hypothetical protein